MVVRYCGIGIVIVNDMYDTHSIFLSGESVIVFIWMCDVHMYFDIRVCMCRVLSIVYVTHIVLWLRNWQ